MQDLVRCSVVLVTTLRQRSEHSEYSPAVVMLARVSALCPARTTTVDLANGLCITRCLSVSSLLKCTVIVACGWCVAQTPLAKKKTKRRCTQRHQSTSQNKNKQKKRKIPRGVIRRHAAKTFDKGTQREETVVCETRNEKRYTWRQKSPSQNKFGFPLNRQELSTSGSTHIAWWESSLQMQPGSRQLLSNNWCKCQPLVDEAWLEQDF